MKWGEPFSERGARILGRIFLILILYIPVIALIVVVYNHSGEVKRIEENKKEFYNTAKAIDNNVQRLDNRVFELENKFRLHRHTGMYGNIVK